VTKFPSPALANRSAADRNPAFFLASVLALRLPLWLSVSTREVVIMGGPWKVKGLEPPAPHGHLARPGAEPAPGGEARVVLAYVVSLVVWAALTIGLLSAGWW
jgi:hypothetical protein